jgi:monoamine oxidase
MNTPLNQAPNPTVGMRHEMLRDALEEAGRKEDYEYIIKYLSPPPDITLFAAPGELRGVKIGIVGGGLSGMCAAYELRKLGADITILEASSNRIGGRVYTHYFDPDRRYYGEFGAMRIPASHETSWHYIDLFQLETRSLTTPRRNNFIYAHNTRLRTSDSIEQYLYPKYTLTAAERNTPWNELTAYALEYRFRSLPPQIRSELIQILPEYSPEFIPLMTMSIRQNFEELGLSQGAIQLISSVDPTIGSLLHISYDEFAHEEYSLDYQNTYRIQGGNVQLPLAFYHSFGRKYPSQYSGIAPELIGKVNFKAGHFVTGIYQSDYRNKIVVKYTCSTEENAAADIFDYVILSIPLSALREVEIKPHFSNQKMQAIMELYYIDALKSLFFCNHRFWERNTEYGQMKGGISLTDLPIQSIIYPPDHNECPIPNGDVGSRHTINTLPYCSPEEPGVLTASYSFEQNSIRVGGMEPRRRFDLIRQNVEEVHGLPRGFLHSLVTDHITVHWNNQPYHRGALANTLPDQKQLFSYELLLPEFNGHVFLAGEHASSKHGWMQGALYSGKSTANRLLEHYHNHDTGM